MPKHDNSSPRGTVQGASAVGEKKPDRRRILALIAGAIVLLVLLALLLSRCGGGNDATGAASSSTAAMTSTGQTSSIPSTSAPSTTAASSAPAATTAATPTAAGGDGSAAGTPGAVLTDSGQSMLDLASGADPAAALAAVTGQGARATGVQVLTVPADEGFWVGTSDTARTWVQLTGSGESSYQVTAGDTVDFTGTVTANPAGYAQTVGLTDADGAAQLTTQGQHIEVAKDAVTLSK